MPSYEFRCQQCQELFEVFQTYQEYDPQRVTCPACDSDRIKRVINPVRIATSEESRLESLVDPSQLAGIEDDPQALGKMMRRMSSEMGEDLGPEFDEVVDRLETGQSPEDIEKELPDLGMDDL